MTAPSEPEPQTSKVRPWLRGLAWVLPGISAPCFLLASFALTYGAGWPDEIFFVLIAAFAILSLACAFFDAQLTIPNRLPTGQPAPKRIGKAMLIFCLLQILIVPALGFTVASGCTFVLSRGI